MTMTEDEGIAPEVEVQDRHLLRAEQAVNEGRAEDRTGAVHVVAEALAQAEAAGAYMAERRIIGGYRVLRMIEYVYPDAATAEKDMERWQIQGSRMQGLVRIRSSVLSREALD